MIKILIVISYSPASLGALVVNRRVAEPQPAHGISRSPEACCGGPVPEEACQRPPVTSSPFLPALAVSSPSFFQLKSFFFCASLSERLCMKFD
jgi:hypothetical protein